MKKQIEEHVHEIDVWNLDGDTLQEVILEITDIVATYRDKYLKLEMSIKNDYDTIRMNVVGTRLETDSEEYDREIREKVEEDRKNKQLKRTEEKELETLNKLAQKYKMKVEPA